jgi:hypothetical protein
MRTEDIVHLAIQDLQPTSKDKLVDYLGALGLHESEIEDSLEELLDTKKIKHLNDGYIILKAAYIFPVGSRVISEIDDTRYTVKENGYIGIDFPYIFIPIRELRDVNPYIKYSRLCSCCIARESELGMCPDCRKKLEKFPEIHEEQLLLVVQHIRVENEPVNETDLECIKSQLGYDIPF